MSFCTQCGTRSTGAAFCSSCGAPQSQGASGSVFPPPVVTSGQSSLAAHSGVQSKKTLTGIMGIVLGGFGIHKFILGYTTEGILQIVITIFTCGLGSLIGLVEGIIYLTKSDEEFVQTYQLNRRGWF